jgi:hypothetical protein
VTLAYKLVKSILSDSTLAQANGFRRGAGRDLHRTSNLGESASGRRWKRPSVTDPEMGTSPFLTASYLH